VGHVRERAYPLKLARHLQPVAVHGPQEDNVRLTVDHRQYAIDPTMWAERPTLSGVDRLGYPGMYRAKIIALPTYLFRRNALPNLVPYLIAAASCAGTYL
jgi:hypothetical protein